MDRTKYSTFMKSKKSSHVEDEDEDEDDISSADVNEDQSYDDVSIEDDMDDEDEEEMEEELALPETLRNIGFKEKMELLKFKRSHNELEWEVEVTRRSDLLAKKIDRERLVVMSKGLLPSAPEVKKTKSQPPTMKSNRGKRISNAKKEDNTDGSNLKGKGKYNKKPQKSIEKVIDDDDDEDASEDKSDVDKESEEDDDDLFDSDEEEEISKRFKDSSNAKDMDVDDDDDEGDDTGKKKPTKLLKIRKSTRDDSEDEFDDNEKSAKVGRRNPRRAPKKKMFEDDDDDDDESDGFDIEMNVKTNSRQKRKKSDVEDDNEERGGRPDRLNNESDDEDDEQIVGKDVVDTSPPASLTDIHRIQIRRLTFLQWVNEPYFEKAVTGCYVRYLLEDSHSIKSMLEEFGITQLYRMAEIKSIERNSRPDKLENGETTRTRLILSVGGTDKRGCKISKVSNSRIKETEYEYYTKSMTNSQLKLITQHQVEVIRRRQMLAIRHIYTNQEIQDMVKNKFGEDPSKHMDFGSAKELLHKRKLQAIAANDYDRMESIQKAEERLERELQIQQKKFQHVFSKQISVNRKNRTENIRRDMSAGNEKRRADQAALLNGVPSTSVSDPFVRRETKPKILWNTGAKLSNAKLDEKAGEVTKMEIESNPAALKPMQRQDSWSNGTASNQLNKSGKSSLDQLRERVKERLGADPYALSMINPRDRYLLKTCYGLPPMGSDEREQFRSTLKGVSLSTAMEQHHLHLQQQQEMEQH